MMWMIFDDVAFNFLFHGFIILKTSYRTLLNKNQRYKIFLIKYRDNKFIIGINSIIIVNYVIIIITTTTII